ncbi:hypothetical protein QW131_18235 [Roseibium salinum]|nr:hypothetical protein [Roseibium salinum]
MAKRPAFGWRFLPKWFHPDKLGNSSVVAFRPESQRHLFHDFKHPIGGNDQNYVSKFAKNSWRFPLAWCPSFKFYGHYFPICLFLNGYERALRDRSAIIIVFHGEPKMRELADVRLGFWGKPKRFSYGPVKWIKAYLEQYSSLQSVTRTATSAGAEETNVEDMAPATLP